MCITLDIDDDLLAAAKENSRRERSTAGDVISRLLRHALTGAGFGNQSTPAGSVGPCIGTAGFVPFPAGPGLLLTNEQVYRLREVEGL